MRRILFRDIHGNQGSIDEELDVNYQGRWDGEIEESINQIEAQYPSKEMYDHLVIELPEAAPVSDVERFDTTHKPD